MRTTVRLLCWLLVGSATVSGCGSDHKTGRQADPLDQVAGFCAEWGKRACNKLVADACLAQSLEECAAAQTEFCLTILPPNYAKQNAVACLDKVRDAYADAKLTADEYDVVINRAAPCDELIEGPGGAGSACTKSDECNTLEDLRCVMRPGEPTGTCEIPVIQGGGRACGEPFQVCDSEFYCNGLNCVERRLAGQPCSPTEPCMADATCAGLEGEAVCTPKLADRETCTQNEECVSRICAFSGTTGRCAPHILLDAADPLCDNLAE